MKSDFIVVGAFHAKSLIIDLQSSGAGSFAYYVEQL